MCQFNDLVGREVEVYLTSSNSWERGKLLHISCPASIIAYLVHIPGRDLPIVFSNIRRIEPTYRSVNSTDITKSIEVSADRITWKKKILVGVDPNNPRPFICRAGDGKGGWFWRYARIQVG